MRDQRAEAVLLQQGAQREDVLGSDRPGCAAARIAQEKGKGIRAHGKGGAAHGEIAAGRGKMAAQV